MKRRSHRWVTLATLLVWQLGVVATWHASALAGTLGGVAHQASAHCAGPLSQSMAHNSGTRASGHHSVPAKGKPEAEARIAACLLKQETTAKGGMKCKRKQAGWDNQYMVKVLDGELD